MSNVPFATFEERVDKLKRLALSRESSTLVKGDPPDLQCMLKLIDQAMTNDLLPEVPDAVTSLLRITDKAMIRTAVRTISSESAEKLLKVFASPIHTTVWDQCRQPSWYFWIKELLWGCSEHTMTFAKSPVSCELLSSFERHVAVQDALRRLLSKVVALNCHLHARQHIIEGETDRELVN